MLGIKAWGPGKRDKATDCVLVSTLGLIQSCPARTKPARLPGASPVGRAMARQHRSGRGIFVDIDALEPFANRVLPKIRTPFTLVTGGLAPPVKLRAPSLDVVGAILGHSKLMAWYAQGPWPDPPDGVAPLPFGLDYHTAAARRPTPLGPPAAPWQQEATLEAARRAALPIQDRRPEAYVPADGPPERRATWDSMARHSAVICAEADRHRPYEAILLGAVPVVQARPTANAALRTLPHIAVPRWDALTPDVLTAQMVRLHRAEFDFAPLLLSYWQDLFRARSPAPLMMNFQTFLETPLAALNWAYQERTGP